MKIVVGYDGSERAKKALKVAQKHAKAFEGKIYIITVGKAEESAEDIVKAQRKLELAVKFVENWGIACEGHFLIDPLEPGAVLVKFAEDHEVDEIIIGVIKKTKVQKFLLGSDAQYVILHSPCMVITVK
jgi:nucleotide-binding universal stress UspA family protein